MLFVVVVVVTFKVSYALTLCLFVRANKGVKMQVVGWLVQSKIFADLFWMLLPNVKRAMRSVEHSGTEME